jgi:hypothetical protein
MSVITLPTNMAGMLSSFSWSQQRRDVVFSSTFGSQAVENSPPLWAVSMQIAPDNEANVGAWQTFLMQLRGRTNQLALWNIGRPVPRGTMRGTMTLGTAIAQGDTTIHIASATEAAKTLVAGDYIGFGSGVTQQVCMVTAAATADGSGNIAVVVEPPARNAITIGSAVTWNMPAAFFRLGISKIALGDYTPGSIVAGPPLDLIEDWRP